MIQRKAIYYPTIIPPLSWLKKAVFYWDKVSSIIPEEWEKNPVIDSPYAKKSYETVKTLIGEGIFEPTRTNSNQGLNENFDLYYNLYRELQELCAKGIIKKRKKINLESEQYFRIHNKKLSLQISVFFDKLGLLKRDIKKLDWLSLEKKTSLIYMALLAKALADIDPDFTVVCTDNPEYERIVFQSNDPKDSFRSLRTNLLEILPSPREDASIEEIIKFRKKRRSELLAFRDVIDNFERDISNAENYQAIKEIIVQNEERIEKERNKLRESLANSKISSVLATASTLIDVKSPSLWETITLSIGSAAALIPPFISVPIIAGTASIQVGSVLVNKHSEKTAKIRESPFSYLYLAEKKGLISKL
jgi:hypothetical protein